MSVYSPDDATLKIPRRAAGGRRLLFVLALSSGFLPLIFAAACGDDRWWLGLLAAANAWVVAVGIRIAASATSLSLLDPFLFVAMLVGTVVPTGNLLLGPPQVQFRPVVEAAVAGRALMACTALVVAVVIGWGASRTVESSGARTGEVMLREVGVTTRRWPSTAEGWLVASAGLVGLTFRLVTVGSSAEGGAGAGLMGLLGTLLTPLVAMGAFLVIARPRSGPAGGMSRGFAALVLVPLAVLGLSTYGLNRAVFIVPAMAMFVMLVRHGRVVRWRRMAMVLGVLGIGFFLMVGQIRAASQQELTGSSQPAQSLNEMAQTSVQVYLQSPYLVGSAFSSVRAQYYGPSSLLASAMSPIPVIGSAYRVGTGSKIYNDAIYNGVSVDQILPVWAEVDRSFNIWTVGILGFAVGAGLRRLEQLEQNAKNVVSSYTAIYAALWLAQLPMVSVAVLVQIAFYFVLPLLAMSSLLRTGLEAEGFRESRRLQR